jgi:YbbR domain-containing protein
MAAFLRRYLMNNLGLKVLSLVLATGLWLAVTREPVAEVERAIPIEFYNIPTNQEISSERIPEVQVRVRGPVRLVRNLQPSDLHAVIDLAHAQIGDRTIDLTAHNVRAPRDLTVVQIVPAQFRLDLDQRATREVEVRPRVTGNFAQGFRIASVKAEPSQVTISGPKQHVDAVEAAITDLIDASGTMERNSFLTHAYVADPLVQVVNSAPIRVAVIMERTTRKESGAGQKE